MNRLLARYYAHLMQADSSTNQLREVLRLVRDSSTAERVYPLLRVLPGRLPDCPTEHHRYDGRARCLASLDRERSRVRLLRPSRTPRSPLPLARPSGRGAAPRLAQWSCRSFCTGWWPNRRHSNLSMLRPRCHRRGRRTDRDTSAARCEATLERPQSLRRGQ